MTQEPSVLSFLMIHFINECGARFLTRLYNSLTNVCRLLPIGI